MVEKFFVLKNTKTHLYWATDIHFLSTSRAWTDNIQLAQRYKSQYDAQIGASPDLWYVVEVTITTQELSVPWG